MLKVYAVKGNWSLDNSIQGKTVAMAFSMVSEIERNLTSQRTKEVLCDKKEQGIKLDRPPEPGKSKLDRFRPKIEALIENGATQKFTPDATARLKQICTTDQEERNYAK